MNLFVASDGRGPAAHFTAEPCEHGRGNDALQKLAGANARLRRAPRTSRPVLGDAPSSKGTQAERRTIPMRPFMTGAAIGEIRPLLQRFHYLGSRVADPMFCFAARSDGGLFGDYGEPQAGIVYASPINRYFGEGAVELVRLVRSDGYTRPLSEFVAWSLRWLRKNTALRYCLSYADPSAGHHGGIYQALSFVLVQVSKGNTVWVNPFTGERVSGRSFDQRRAGFQSGWERRRSAGKYLYVRELNESRAGLLARFGWAPLPYPKPDKAEPAGT
jgi:hypothetical protein